VTFTKDDSKTDMGDNGGPRGVIVYARNASQEIAARMGLTWMLALDDDYNWFGHRFIDGPVLRCCITRRFDEVVEMYLDFLEDTGSAAVAFAQGGDLLGGAQGDFRKGLLKRKAMNSIFTRVDRPVKYVGRLNEDVSAYVAHGATGSLFLTAYDFSLDQESTQQSQGGMSETYKATGTYVKSFHTVMRAPSAVKISVLGEKYDRVHHSVNWNHAVPKIISGSYRKEATDGRSGLRIHP
jgi:hypothetical protein